MLSLSTGYWSRPECTGQPPPKRYGHSAVMVAANLMLLFGGCSAQVCSLFWTLLGYLCHSSCTAKVSGCPGSDGHCSFWPRGLIRILAAKDLPSSAYFSSTDTRGTWLSRLFALRGTVLQGAFYNDVHLLNTSTFRWHRIGGVGAQPPARYGHACAAAAGRVVIHGGSKGSHAFDGLLTISTAFGREFNRCSCTSTFSCTAVLDHMIACKAKLI